VEAAISLSQEGESQHVPRIDMEFETPEQAYNFYNSYALIVGFSTVKTGTYKSREKATLGEVTRRIFKCQRGGATRVKEAQEEGQSSKQQKHGVQTSKASRKRKQVPGIVDEAPPVPAARKKRCDVVDKTNCQAEMVITKRGDQWVVTRLNLEHNHNLLAPALSKLLRSHRYLTDQEKAMIRTFTNVNVPNRKILAFISFLRGGMQFTNLTKKDVSNYRTRVLRESGQNDITQVISFLRKKQAEDPMFFFSFDADEENKVRNIFWAYGASRCCYQEYGDVISFDTTYQTNRYNLKFAPFVGINGHGDNLLFAGAVLSDETIPTFRWLFSTFRACMGGKAPVSIITDQDAAMRAAIELEFPDAIHRNCLFHIVSKAEILLGPALSGNEKFARDFYDIVYNPLTVEEFERLWQYMLNKHKVHHLKYLKAMYENRKKFIPVYFKDKFFPFICSTSRSEGTNAIFKDNVGPTSSLILFVQEFDRIVKNIDEKGNLRDKNKAQEKALLHSTYTFERQARDCYNTQIFYRFQQLVKATGRYQADEVEKDRVYMIYKSEEHAKHEVRPRKYLVLVDLIQENYTCICARFQKDGILCVHVLRTLIQLNKHTIPEKYFIDRWRPVEKKQVRNITTMVPAELQGGSSTLRYNLLSNKFVGVASDACLSLERTNYMIGELDRIHSEIRNIVVRQGSINGNTMGPKHQLNIENGVACQVGVSPTQGNSQEMNGMSSRSTMSGCNVTDTSCVDRPPLQTVSGCDALDSLKNPDVVPRKGRPKNIQKSRRLMPTGEHVRKKKQITCSICGSHDHNKATCSASGSKRQSCGDKN